MLLFVGIGWLLTIFIIWLHYGRHFKCKKCHKHKSYKEKGCCIIPINDDEEFDIIPISFLYYTIFMLFLSSLIVVKVILIYKTWTDRVYEFSYMNASNFQFYDNNPLNTLHQLNIERDNIFIYIIDLFVVYGIMLLSVSESLFLFYKYYATKQTATTLDPVSTMEVIIWYLLYGIPFIIIFVLQINVYYWLFPVLIVLHTTFNFYCTLKFSSLLIDRFSFFAEMQDVGHNDPFGSSIIPQLYFMRKISIIVNIFQSLYIAIFVIAYNINIIYYLPILWSSQSILFGLNFVRNREFLKKKCCKYNNLHLNFGRVKTTDDSNSNSNKPKLHVLDTSIQPTDLSPNCMKKDQTEMSPVKPIASDNNKDDSSSSSEEEPVAPILTDPTSESVLRGLDPINKKHKDEKTNNNKDLDNKLHPQSKKNILPINNTLHILQEEKETNFVGDNDNINDNINDIEDSLSKNISKCTQHSKQFIYPYNMLTKHGFLSTKSVTSTEQSVFRLMTQRQTNRELIVGGSLHIKKTNKRNVAIWSDKKSQTNRK